MLQPATNFEHAVLTSASSKIAWRLIPFLMLCYFVAYLDRVNLGFAALTFKADLGLSDSAYGFGVGVFFLGYFIFEVPSNILLEKIGARVWIARIMFTWGILSGAMAFVRTENAFYLVRFLLGIAEAGFFPGIILYLTYWYTSPRRAKIIAYFMAAIPISIAVGAPLSTWILELFGGLGGLKGWQWLFIIEASPAIILSFVAYKYLTDRPTEATWLSANERRAIVESLAADTSSREALRKYTLRAALVDSRVLALGVIYFGLAAGLYGLGFWLPLIIKGFGLSTIMIGWVVAVPYAVSALCMMLWARHSDRTRERIWHVAGAMTLGGIGLIGGAYLASPVLSLMALTLASVGTFAAFPTFWTLPTAMLTGMAAAGGIALINSIGNIGGFVGPYLVGWIRETFRNPTLGTAALGGFMLLSALFVVLLGDPSKKKATVTASQE